MNDKTEPGMIAIDPFKMYYWNTIERIDRRDEENAAAEQARLIEEMLDN